MSFLSRLLGMDAPAPIVKPQLIVHPVLDIKLALAVVAPKLSAADLDAWVAALAAPMQREAINTPSRIAAFLGTCSVESAGFTVLSENLNYGAQGLCSTWPTRFTPTLAATCARQPEMIANLVYANRMGNGDTASGDGWKFRGRGLISMTFRGNYQSFAQHAKISIEDSVVYLDTKEGAAASACWFWGMRNLNPLADAWSITTLTRLVNGGVVGLAQRITLSNAALKALV